MLDDMEESRSAHSIGIVENPLYAEDEAGPTYSHLAAKEKEAEVCKIAKTVINRKCYWYYNNMVFLHRHMQAEMETAPEKGQAFSVNFGPPSTEDEY